MIYLFALFIVAVFRIWNEKIPLLKTFVTVSLMAYLTFNFFGVDHFIATKNIDRYFRTGKIDVSYLTGLSDDAVPQLVRLLKAEDEELVWEIEDDLYYRKLRLEEQQSWQSYNLAKSRAWSVLKRLDLNRYDRNL